MTLCKETLSQYITEEEALEGVVREIMGYVPSYSLLKDLVLVEEDVGHMDRRQFMSEALTPLIQPFMNDVGDKRLTHNMTKALLVKAHQRIFGRDTSARTTGGSAGAKRKQVRCRMHPTTSVDCMCEGDRHSVYVM